MSYFLSQTYLQKLIKKISIIFYSHFYKYLHTTICLNINCFKKLKYFMNALQ